MKREKIVTASVIILFIGIGICARYMIFSNYRKNEIMMPYIIEEALSNGYSGNSVNTSIFRKNSITTYADPTGITYTFCSYYDENGNIIIARKKGMSDWEFSVLLDSSALYDAHNSISMVADANGYIHLAFSNHAGELYYYRSKFPCSINLEKSLVIGDDEEVVTYPEFYKKPSGDIFMLYRSGVPGRGYLVVNNYSIEDEKWYRIHSKLIDGEESDAPYWQACVDDFGRLHISWTWRRTADVETNHNIYYIVSEDESADGFINAEGEHICVPITPHNDTETNVIQIPENSALINQTSMITDDNNKPYITSYWRTEDVVQYHILFLNSKSQWVDYDTGIRKTNFSLTGWGTKELPCARPIILTSNEMLYLVTKDAENDYKAMIHRFDVSEDSINIDGNLVITKDALGTWEPTYDLDWWKDRGELLLFVQKCEYVPDIIKGEESVQDGNTPSNMVYIAHISLSEKYLRWCCS